MDMKDLFDNDVVGSLTKKYGVKPDQAKGVLDKVAPFVKDKLGGKPKTAAKARAANLEAYATDPARLAGKDADDHGNELLADVDPAEREAKIQEIARASGLDPKVVRDMLPAATTATVGAMDKRGAFAHLLQVHTDLQRRLDEIKLDASDGVIDGKVFGVPIPKK
jgi:hypothetical protein